MISALGELKLSCARVARDAWLDELELTGASVVTVSQYKAFTGEALALMSARADSRPEDFMLEDIDRDGVVFAVTKFRDRPDGRNGAMLTRSNGSVSVFLAAMRSFLNWCVETGKLASNPAATIKRPKLASRVPKALSVEDCGLLVAAAATSRHPQRDRLIVLMGLTMGLRLAEITGVQVESFVPNVKAATHLRVVGKGDKERAVPVPEVVREALSAYLTVRGPAEGRLLMAGLTAMTKSGVGQVMDRIVRRAGLKRPGIRVHMTRHSFATHVLATDAGDLMTVKELLGHSSVATTQVYLKVDPARLAASVDANPLAGL